ncbi:hypothetical protein VKT23_006158 [Stygiomarasmius scandens]|uniref:Uncharacterized protein n=1 Tax=Marasmiellus scandens TaxID=2682957 RepID=A0ABR1JQT1_9AGAR
MTLTQTARLPGPGPSWDEDVVPVLRKRLENESRTLARRISAISASSSTEDLDSTNYYNNSNYSNSTTARPTTTSRTHSNSSVAPSQSSHRSRTTSQPYRVNGINGTPSTPTSSSAIRSISPRPSTSNSNYYIDSPHTKPSRIPQPIPATRTRAASITGHTQFPSPTNSSHHTIPVPIPGYGYGSPTTPTQDTSRSADLWIVHETSPHASASTSFPSSASSSITSAQRGQALLNEPAPPFKPGTGYSPSSSVNHSHENGIGFPYTNGTSRQREDEDDDSEEEEHPFEHWYRGEISRNGGVGELRVGKRQEMLEIANYGHDLSPQGRKQNAITEAIEERRRQRERAGRRRADSMGSLGERASFYMDPDKAKEVARVLDENPLTDFEDQDEFSADGHDRYYRGHGNDMDVDDDTYHGERTKTPTLMAPAYRRGQSEPLYSGSGFGARSSPSLGLNSTPQQGRIGTAKGTKLPSTPSQSQNQRSGPRSRATSATKRAASTSPSPGPPLPGTPSKSPSANSRMQASKATKAVAKWQKALEECQRGSVATYVLPGIGEGRVNTANMIPIQARIVLISYKYYNIDYCFIVLRWPKELRHPSCRTKTIRWRENQ